MALSSGRGRGHETFASSGLDSTRLDPTANRAFIARLSRTGCVARLVCFNRSANIHVLSIVPKRVKADHTNNDMRVLLPGDTRSNRDWTDDQGKFKEQRWNWTFAVQGEGIAMAILTRAFTTTSYVTTQKTPDQGQGKW